MSRTPLDDRLTELDARIVDQAEADLTRMISLEPSAEFAVSLRARMVAEAPVRGWASRRLVLTLVTASALIIAVSLGGGRSVRDDVGPRVSPPRQELDLRSMPPVSATPAVTPRARPQRRTVRSTPPRVVSAGEVIVDPSIAVAIRRLAIAARSTVLDEAAARTPPRATPEPDALTVAEPLVVPKLALTPADPAGGV